jgi:hypothetical protein
MESRNKERRPCFKIRASIGIKKYFFNFYRINMYELKIHLIDSSLMRAKIVEVFVHENKNYL